MNKTELIAAMVETSGLTKKDCEAALAAFTGAETRCRWWALAASRSRSALPAWAATPVPASP